MKKQGSQDSRNKPLRPTERDWLAEVESKALAALSRNQLSVSLLAEAVGLSERHLRRRLKKLTGIQPSDYLREIRLQRAKHFLENGTYGTVTEVALATGFSTPDYFSRLFSERFGKLPSAILYQHQ